MRPKQKHAAPNVKLLLRIFWTTFKIGAVTFGGGYAMIPLMRREFADRHGWVEAGELVDMLALSQSVPGGIIINFSTFIGYRVAGAPGALCAVTGVSLPSLLTIMAVYGVYAQFRDNIWVSAALRGVHAGVVAMIFSAVINLKKDTIKDLFGWILMAAALLLSLFTTVNTLWLLLAGAVVGLVRRKYFSGRGIS